jgi:hypothetical protein
MSRDQNVGQRHNVKTGNTGIRYSAIANCFVFWCFAQK